MEREILVEIGPLKEYEGIKSEAGENYGFKFISNGKANTLKIQVHIEKSIAGAANTAQIYLWNLSRETREALNTPGLSVNIYTRVNDGKYVLAFFGGLSGSFTERIGSDLRTRLMCWSAASNLYQEAISISYTKDVPIKNVVTEIAQKIPGIVVDPLMIKIDGKVGEKGISEFGSIPYILDSLARQYGFSWSVLDGVFKAFPDGRGENTSFLLTASNGLIKVSPRFSGITQVQVGVDIYSKYIEGINPYQNVRIESDVHPEKMNGEYLVHTLDADLCPKEEEGGWNMHISFFFREGDNG